MEVRTNSFAFLHRPSFSIIAAISMFHRVLYKWHRKLCEEHCFVEYLKWEIVGIKRMKGLRGRETVGNMEREREREEGEGKALPVETPTFPMSSYKPERSPIQYLIHAERKSAHNVSTALKGHRGVFCWSWERFETVHIAADNYSKITNHFNCHSPFSRVCCKAARSYRTFNIYSDNAFSECSQKMQSGCSTEPWLDAELNEPTHITPTSSLPPNAEQINSLSLQSFPCP